MISNKPRLSLIAKLITIASLSALFVFCLSGCALHGGVLNPKGLIAKQERTLLFDSLAIMMVVVLPVIIMSIAFAVRYRSSHKTSDYRPNWSHNTHLEIIWWTVPCIIVVVLGIMTWIETHRLDPYKKIAIPGKPLLIEAVSLRWKWLFIYPEQHIATVNYIQIPKDRQVEFWITSDAPMSSFFIPQLGSQIFSMAGMRTRLHLVANYNGTYEGLNTQYNGDGFSDMHFKVKVTDTDEYNSWITKVKSSSNHLDLAAYKQLVAPSVADPAKLYSTVRPGLFKLIMQQFTKPNVNLH